MIRSELHTQGKNRCQSGRFDLEITTHDVVLPLLPPAAEGLTIAQISDLHRGCGGTDDLIREAVVRVNALEPDIIAITGDFVDRHKRDVLPVVKMVSGLRARRGVYASSGNHDHRSDLLLLMSALEAEGITVLNNTARETMPGLWMAGIDELYEGKPDIAAALAPVPSDAALVFLAHHPNTLDRVPADRPMLMLAGHTHGGQIALPFPTPYMVCRLHLHTRYVHGWYRSGNTQLYVNRGIGVTGGGPFARRRRCPSEITLFRLTAG